MATAIITGAAGGIGQTIVRVFSEAGYKIVAIDKAKIPEGLCCYSYQKIDLFRLVEDEMYAKTSISCIREKLAGFGLDVLINNAAVQVLGGVENLTREDWKLSLNVNLLAPFLLTQGLSNELQQVGGSVINISSIHARLTKKNFVAYATTKAALSGMTRAMAVDLGPKVRVNAIEPAAIETTMLRNGFCENPERYLSLKDCHPQQRIGSTLEAARLALFLASRDASFLHGTCIALDGGVGARLFDPD